MRAIPDEVFTQYEALLAHRTIARHLHGHYKKWLRYFLDYCVKYPTAGGNPEHTRLFLENCGKRIKLLYNVNKRLTPWHFSLRCNDCQRRNGVLTAQKSPRRKGNQSVPNGP